MVALGVRDPKGAGAEVAGGLGQALVAANGALGISSKTCADSGKERRTATRAPPAEMFSAVANSRELFAFFVAAAHKYGDREGRRGHLRRSVSGFGRFKLTPLDTR